jgi:hypothetical protein
MMTLIRIGLAIAAVIGGGVLVNAALNPPVNFFVSALERLERREPQRILPLIHDLFQTTH